MKTQMLATSVNEQLRLRSSYYAMNSEGGELGFDTEPFEFVDPIVRATRIASTTETAVTTAQAQSDFEDQLGYTATHEEG